MSFVLFNDIFFKIDFLFLFFDCGGSSELYISFLSLWQVGATHHCGAQASKVVASLVAEHRL